MLNNDLELNLRNSNKNSMTMDFQNQANKYELFYVLHRMVNEIRNVTIMM